MTFKHYNWPRNKTLNAEGLKKTLSDFFTRTEINSWLTGFLIPSNFHDLVVEIDSCDYNTGLARALKVLENYIGFDAGKSAPRLR